MIDANKYGLPKSQLEIFLTIVNWKELLTKDDTYNRLIVKKYGAKALQLTEKIYGKKLSKEIINEIKNIQFISILTHYAEPKRFSDLTQLNTHLKTIQSTLKSLNKLIKESSNNHIDNVVIGLDDYIADFDSGSVGNTAMDLRKQLMIQEHQLKEDKKLMLKKDKWLKFFSVKGKNPNLSKRYSYLIFCLIHLWEKVLKQKSIPKQFNTSTQKNHPAIEFINEWLIGLTVAPSIITYTQVRTLIREAKQNPDHKYIALRKLNEDKFWEWLFNIFPLHIPQDSHTKQIIELKKKLKK